MAGVGEHIRAIVGSAFKNFMTLVLFFIKPKLFLSRLITASSLSDSMKFAFWVLVFIAGLQAVSDRLFNYAGYDTFWEFASCNFMVVQEFKKNPQIAEFIEQREEWGASNSNVEPFYMGMKLVGPGLQVSTGDEAVDKRESRVLEFGLATKIAFPQACLLDYEAPQMAFVKFGFASVLFDLVKRDDVNNDVVAFIFLLLISATFAISVWYVLVRLSVVVNVRRITALSLYSVTIWHALIYLPLPLVGIYHSFDQNLSLHFDLFRHMLILMNYGYLTAIVLFTFFAYYLRKLSGAGYGRVLLGTVLGGGISCLLVPLVMVPVLYVIFRFGYWFGMIPL